MMMIHQLTLLSLLIAQDPSGGNAEPRVLIEPDDVLVRVGDMYGRIIAVESDEVTVELTRIPGSRATLQKDAVSADKLFLYRKAKMDADDPQAWSRLAEFANQNDLFIRRIEALRAQAKLAPSKTDELERKIAQTRSDCAEKRLQQARELREQGDLDAAVDHLEETVASFEECEASDRARKLLNDIRGKLSEEREQAEQVQKERRALREENPALGDVRELIDAGNRYLQSGRRRLDDYVDAKDDFEDALARFSRARDRIEELAARDDDQTSSAVRKERQRLRRLARRKQVTTHIELGHVYVARGDRQSAYLQAGRAAALDPGNARVGDLRRAIAAIGSR